MTKVSLILYNSHHKKSLSVLFLHCHSLFLDEDDDSHMEIEGIGEEVPQEINDEEEEEEEEVEDEEDPEEEGNEESVDDPEGVNKEAEVQSEPTADNEPKKVLHLRNARTKRGRPRLQESSLPFLDELDNL